MHLLFRRLQICLLVLGAGLQVMMAQSNVLTQEDVDRYQDELKSMVSFYQFTLNTLGDPLATARQKETIINESYAKFFRDENVQVEDDLISDRTTVVNKNVQAYLKDISFFYQSVRFQWFIENITYERNDAGEFYFLVEGTRTLSGISREGDSVQNNIPRFIEVNLDQELNELKIVSVYTTRENEMVFLTDWWNNLSGPWQRFFAAEFTVGDSLTLADLRKEFPQANLGDTLVRTWQEKTWADDSLTLQLLAAVESDVQLGDTIEIEHRDSIFIEGPQVFQSIKRMTKLEKLDISGNKEILSLHPLSQLTGLKELNASKTLIRDLFPLRNLIYLRQLNLAETQIRQLSPLRFLTRIEQLNLTKTPIQSLEPLGELKELQQLNINQTSIQDLSPLAGAEKLSQLYLRNTQIKSLEPLQSIPGLQRIDASGTQISTLRALAKLPKLKALYINRTQLADLAPISGLQELSLLFCEHTPVANLDPLLSLNNLRRVYCDSSKVQATHARSFMARKPQTLVVYGSMALRSWWSGLDSVWRDVFTEKFRINMLPKREQLHQMVGLSALDIKDNAGISSLQPLSMLSQLQELNAAGTGITALTGIEDLVSLRKLDISRTAVADLTPLQDLKDLAHLNMGHTKVNDLGSLNRHLKLESLKVEGTQVKALMPLIQLGQLTSVWADSTQLSNTEVQRFLDSLDQECLVVFRTAKLKSWWDNLNDAWKGVFRNHASSDNEPDPAALHVMANLTQIQVEGRPLQTLDPLKICERLEVLVCDQANISLLTPLANLQRLHTLSLAENPLGDVSILGTLPNLKSLDLHNTPLVELEFVANLRQIERLNCRGTALKKLGPLEGLPQLAQLDISNTPVKKLKTLETLPKLTELICFNTGLKAKSVDNLRSIRPKLTITYY